MMKKLSNITRKESQDTGMAMVLLSLIIGYFFIPDNRIYLFAIVLLVITMTSPILFKPIGVLWFGLSHVLGTIVSSILLSTVYVVLVVPFGIVLNIVRKDPLKIRQFKKARASVFVVRNHQYSENDIIYPF